MCTVHNQISVPQILMNLWLFNGCCLLLLVYLFLLSTSMLLSVEFFQRSLEFVLSTSRSFPISLRMVLIRSTAIFEIRLKIRHDHYF